MDISVLGVTGVAAIVIICYLVGEIVKNTSVENKWVPVICGVAGGVLGIAGMFVMPEFPADDIITAIAVGVVSGMAATGVNQACRQLGNYYTTKTEG